MPELKRQIGKVAPPTIGVTAKRPPADPSLAVAPIASSFVKGAISGFATSQIKEDVMAATGASVSPEQVQERTQQFGEKMAQEKSVGPITPEQYQQASGEFLGELDADAKTVLNLVKTGQISSLQGEAFVRKRVGAAMANPFWAALGGRIQDAAGPLGGGRNVAQSAFGTPQMSELEIRAEAQRKALQEKEQMITSLQERTRYPREVIENFATRQARWQMRQDQETMTVTDSLNHQIEGTHLGITEAIASRLDPETNTLGSTSVSELTVMLGQRENDLVAAINSSNIPTDAKKAKVAMIRDMMEGYRENIGTQSKTTVTDMMNKQTSAELKLMGTQQLPMHSFLVANGLQDMANGFAMLNSDQMKGEMIRKFGAEATEDILSLTASQSPVLFAGRAGPLQPTPGLGAMLGTPGAPNIVKEAANTPDYTRKLSAQTRKYPVETLHGINRGPLLRAANSNEQAAQETMITAVETSVGQISADLQLFGSEGTPAKVSVSMKPDVNRRIPFDKPVINVPDGMEDRGDELKELFRMVQKSQWMWPEGATNTIEAFEAIVNGEHSPAVGKDALSPRDVRVEKLAAEHQELSKVMKAPSRMAPFSDPEDLRQRMKEIADELSQNPDMSSDMFTEIFEEVRKEIGIPEGKDEPAAQIFHGDQAVEQVAAKEGQLSFIEEFTVREEGYATGDYKDEKGITTSGAGQTGKFQKMSFKEAFAAHKAEADKAIPNLSKLPEEVQAPLYASWYRGMLSDSPKAIKLINEGKYAEAADEFLDAKDYRKGSEGVKRRMERVADALRGLQ